MSIYIKNADTVDHTWSGQTISASAYYLIEDIEKTRWQTNSQLISDIGSGIAIVARSNDGTEDITDVNTAIDYLKEKQLIQIEQTAIINPNGKRARLIGTHNASAVANTTTHADWLIPQTQYPAGTNVSSIFDGIQYYAEDSTVGDSLDFAVVDKDGAGVTLGLYPQVYYDAYKDGNGVLVVEQFGDSWYIAPNNLEDIVLYKAALIPGLYIRVSYTNTHATNTVDFICNIFRHLDL